MTSRQMDMTEAIAWYKRALTEDYRKQCVKFWRTHIGEEFADELIMRVADVSTLDGSQRTKIVKAEIVETKTIATMQTTKDPALRVVPSSVFVELTDEDIEECRKRSDTLTQLHSNSKRSARREVDTSTTIWQKVFDGVSAEKAVTKYLSVPMPPIPYGYDGGVDLLYKLKKIQIKSGSIKHDHAITPKINELKAVDLFISACNLTKHRVMIRGYCTPKTFIDKHVVKDWGCGATASLHFKWLEDFRTFIQEVST